MSKKVNYSLYGLMVLFIASLSIQKFTESKAMIVGMDWLMLGTAIGIIGLVYWIKGADFQFFFSGYDLAYYLFLLAVLISAFLNPETNIFYYLRSFVIYYLVLNLAVRNLPDYLTPKLFLRSFVLAYLPMIAYHLIKAPDFLGNSAYSGLFSNPNGLGVFMTTAAIGVSGYLFALIADKKWLKSVFYVILSLVSLYLLMITGSRTAFLAVFLALTVALIFYITGFLKAVNQKQRILFLILFIVFIFLAYLVLKDSYLALVFQESIIDKFVYQMQKSRLLSGRERIWSYYLKGSYPFKSGYQPVRDFLDLSPHNAFIDVIARFGQVAGFFYLISWLLALKNVFYYAFKSLGKDKYLPFYLMAVIAFIGTALMEVVTYHPLVYLALFANARVLVSRNQDQVDNKLSL